MLNAARRELLALRLQGRIGQNTTFSGNVVKLGSVGDVLGTIWHLKAVELLAVDSHKFIVFAITHKVGLEVLKCLELSNVDLVIGPWRLELAYQSVHCLHLRLGLPHHENLLNVPFLGSLGYQRVRLVEMVRLAGGAFSFLLLITCFVGVHATH